MMNKWIFPKDELPPLLKGKKWSADVLVWCENYTPIAYKIGDKYMAVDRYCIWNDNHTPSFRTDRFLGKVIAWMKLPKPPKDEK